MPVNSILHVALLAVCCASALSSGNVEMKIVDEPSSYGFGNSHMQHWGGGLDDADKLKMRVQPANISGPSHLFHLRKHCFSEIFENYKYTFCPFSNVTQHEQGYHWNPYNGILGIWQEWEIENNTFVSMEMQEGDDCGQFHRSVKVKLECGNSSRIVSVSEPTTCHYLMIFHTPLVCHPQSLLVYPTLPPELRTKWDKLEGQLFRKELTLKGYKKRLQIILEDAGLRLSANKRQNLAAVIAAKEEREKENYVEFPTLSHCSQMYKRLKQEVKELKAELAMYKNNNETKASNNASLQET